MAGHGEKLTRLQERAVAALLQHATQKKAAEAIGVSERTLSRWMQMPAFLAAWRAARRQTFETALAELERHALRAVRTLVRNLKAAKESDQNTAAALLLRNRKEYADLGDVIDRIEALENKLKARSKP